MMAANTAAFRCISSFLFSKFSSFFYCSLMLTATRMVFSGSDCFCKDDESIRISAGAILETDAISLSRPRGELLLSSSLHLLT